MYPKAWKIHKFYDIYSFSGHPCCDCFVFFSSIFQTRNLQSLVNVKSLHVPLSESAQNELYYYTVLNVIFNLDVWIFISCRFQKCCKTVLCNFHEMAMGKPKPIIVIVKGATIGLLWYLGQHDDSTGPV